MSSLAVVEDHILQKVIPVEREHEDEFRQIAPSSVSYGGRPLRPGRLRGISPLECRMKLLSAAWIV